jgi:hypothetical protein
MARFKRQIAKWTEGRAPADLAAQAAGAIVIAVVPGALVVWLAYRIVRSRLAAG